MARWAEQSLVFETFFNQNVESKNVTMKMYAETRRPATPYKNTGDDEWVGEKGKKGKVKRASDELRVVSAINNAWKRSWKFDQSDRPILWNPNKHYKFRIYIDVCISRLHLWARDTYANLSYYTLYRGVSFSRVILLELQRCATITINAEWHLVLRFCTKSRAMTIVTCHRIWYSNQLERQANSDDHPMSLKRTTSIKQWTEVFR